MAVTGKMNSAFWSEIWWNQKLTSAALKKHQPIAAVVSTDVLMFSQWYHSQAINGKLKFHWTQVDCFVWSITLQSDENLNQCGFEVCVWLDTQTALTGKLYAA